MNGITLFSSAGIGETYFKESGINILVANEIIKKRADLYQHIYPETKMVCGDITDTKTVEEIHNAIGDNKIDLIVASPPCQGMSLAGKNRTQCTMVKDDRNYLVLSVIQFIKKYNPKFVLIENVPMLLKIKLEYNGQTKSILEILEIEFGGAYEIKSDVLDSADYSVPQTRTRAIIRMFKKGLDWKLPKKQPRITVRQAIGHLPPLESGEQSNIKWHYARKHDRRQVEWMKHTSTGKSAFTNEVHYPQKENGKRVKGYESSYRRIKWDEPSPTITMRSDAISSQRNVHAGRLLSDGTYSDARVLTPLEIMLLNSLPADWNIPDDTHEILIRQCIGESIPPKMLQAIIKEVM